MEMIENPTLELADELISEYCKQILSFLETGKHSIKPAMYMQCYDCVVKLSDEMSLSEQLYTLYKQKIDEMLSRVESKVQAKISDSKEFLIEYLQQWRNYTVFVYSLNKIMQYLDRFHLKNQGDKSLTATSLNKFRDRIFKRQLLNLRGSILNEIKKDRLGEMVDYVLIKNSIQQFIYMGYEEKVVINKRGGAQDLNWTGDRNLMVYDKEFEIHLKNATEEFYSTSSDKWRLSLSCFEYVHKVSKHLMKEETNADTFLQMQTKPHIINIVLTETVEKYAQQITELNMGVAAMFDDKKDSELKLIYDVFLRKEETLKFIIQKMDPFIVKEGEKIVLSGDLQKKPLEMVSKMLKFKSDIDKLIADSFQNDMRFQKARDQSFQTFMNKFKQTPAFIALYMDNSQKEAFRQMAMPEIERQIDQVIKLFCCLNGRDEFITAYSLLLADRLLNKLSQNDEAEESVIKQLQVECGHNIVSKIKTMIADINKSKDLFDDFIKHNKNTSVVQNIEFGIQVLTSGHWPFQSKKKLTVPSQLRNTQMVFNQFYQKKFANRQLIWLYDKGSLVLQTTYLDRPYQLECNSVQASILMLFNEQDRVTCEEVIQKLTIDLPTFKAAVKTNLCRPKLGVIQNESGKPAFDNPKEELYVNMKYKDKMIKKNFCPKQTAEQMVNQKEGGIIKQVDESVEVARQHIIDSVAVRNMKARKVESMTGLMQAIISQITMFTADPRMIKKRIENLMERGFIKRDEEDNKKLIYIP